MSEEPGNEHWALDEHGVWRKRRGITGSGPRRSRGKLGVAAWIGGIGVAGLAVVLILSGAFSSNGAAASGYQPTATKPALAARQTAEAFLAAWQDGHIRQAAKYTDHPAAAAAALTSYRNGLHLRALRLAVQSVSRQGRATFSAAATVGLAGNPAVTATWSYASALVAYAKNGGWWDRWNPALVAPRLTAGEKVVSVPVPPGAGEVVDAAGGNLENSSDPGLRNIAAALMKSGGHRTPGIDVAFVGPGSTAAAGTAAVLTRPVGADVKTTIDPRVEAAAKSAVQGHPDS